MNELGTVFSDAMVAEIERVVDERVQAALEAHAGGSSADAWLTLRECAEHLHVSERTVARLMKKGRIRACFVGRRVLVKASDLDSAVRGDA